MVGGGGVEFAVVESKSFCIGSKKIIIIGYDYNTSGSKEHTHFSQKFLFFYIPICQYLMHNAQFINFILIQ